VVSHVGKSYSIVAHQMANQLVATCPEIAEATCLLVSRIGQAVDSPQAVELQIRTHDGVALERVHDAATAIARDCVRRITGLSELLLARASIESPATWPGVPLF
jgi:S-adenosylmethionine synthetase